MSTYSTTHTIDAIGGVVDVARNGIDTEEGDKVRLYVIDGTGYTATVRLTQAQAERLAVAILEAADLTAPLADDGPHTGGIGGRAVSYRNPIDRDLNAIRVAVANARAHDDVGVSSILGRVAEGLTGKLGGIVERALASRMGAVYGQVITADPDELRIAEQRAAEWARAQAVAAEKARQDGWDA